MATLGPHRVKTERKDNLLYACSILASIIAQDFSATGAKSLLWGVLNCVRSRQQDTVFGLCGLERLSVLLENLSGSLL